LGKLLGGQPVQKRKGQHFMDFANTGDGLERPRQGHDLTGPQLKTYTAQCRRRSASERTLGLS
ncbi:MAG: hypothetical protein ABJB10_21370, partial [Mesorhizobium sp.]